MVKHINIFHCYLYNINNICLLKLCKSKKSYYILSIKNILPQEIIEKSNYSERRLIAYLMSKRGKPGLLLKNPGEKNTLRLESLLSLVQRGVVKISDFDSQVVYFNFTDNFEYGKISISLGSYID